MEFPDYSVGCSRSRPHFTVLLSYKDPLRKAGLAQLSRPSGLLPSFALIAFKLDVPLCVGAVVRLGAAIRTTLVALPQGSSLRTGLCCPGPSTLNRPHPPQLRAHPDFAALRLIRDAFAVQIPTMPRRPTTGSELSLMVFRNMSSSETTENFPVALTQYFTGDTSLDLGLTVSAFPSPSHSDPSEVCVFEA